MSSKPHIERLAHWPDLAALHAHAPDRYPFLLESVAHGPQQARWDILFALPGERLTLDGAGFLDRLDTAWAAQRRPADTVSQVPFQGGWFLYLGYELAAEIEPRLDLPCRRDDPLPVAAAIRSRGAILRDHANHEAWLVVEGDQRASLSRLRDDLDAAAPLPPTEGALTDTTPVEDAASDYLEAVERARRYILDGDIFQANLSRAWRARLREGATALDCYRRLQTHNPAPFAGFMRWSETVSVASSSPERLVRVAGDRVDSRPIAGTRPRGEGRVADSALAVELLAHPKERAEHVMLIDLARNDIGRICRPGSVVVDEMMVVESYTTVHHIVSNVHGRLQPGTSPGAVIRAVFPGGTITGCPKVRCMEIIAELEGMQRGAYTGSFGWLGHSGDLDLNILIRTMTIRGGDIELRAGAGIVADSDPERELEESRSKAAGLLRALSADA